MRTRSQRHLQEYLDDIDFDDASTAWKANKVSKGNGTYGYCCKAIKRDGNQCSHEILGRTDYCKRHISNICKK